MKKRIATLVVGMEKTLVFGLAFFVALGAIIALDDYVFQNRLYFIRTGDFESLILLLATAYFISYILKKLLVLQWKWGVER
ncbi:MAG: hypothetical protein HY393_01020 [Candidatus Diapherotrites archaeon]|nr:hypothetical protein [Candidatus Diapherotrites archaeon]